jgi:malic enzyme-like protein
MNTEGDRAGRVNTRIRISLLNVSGALSPVTAAVSTRGGLVRAVPSLHGDPWRRVVEIDLVAAGQEQCAAIIGAIKYREGVLVEGETDPALEAHRGGTIAVQARVPFRSEQDFSTVYTPGAGRVAQATARVPALVHSYPAIPHLVALVSNGTAVLGLGDIGPRAAMPALEGKTVRLETFALRSGGPILLNTKDPKRWCRHCAPHRALDARVSHISAAMKLAAARQEQALAGHVPAAPRRQEVQDAAR